MGFNISGIVINKNFQSNLEELTEKFGWDLNYLGEIDFETASNNWKEEGICDIYFSEKGTFMFLNMDDCVTPYKFQNCNVLTFALSEASMAFNLNYTENQKEVRSIMEVNDKKMTNDGGKLDVELDNDGTSEIIWKKIQRVLGESFWDIKSEEKCFRYKYSKISKSVAENKIQVDNLSQNIIKGKTEYCHIISPTTTILFTDSGKIEDYKSSNQSALTNKINEFVNLIIPVILIGFSIYYFSKENYIISTILGILSLYLLYSFFTQRKIGDDNIIKKEKVKKVRYLDKEKNDHSLIEIIYINRYGKTKKRPFTLDGKINDGSNIAENALEIMAINGIIE